MSDQNPSLRVVPYFSPVSRTTCYIVAPREGTGAILVDPVHVDNDFYALLLRLQIEVRWIVVTHPEEYMRHPLHTLGRIFAYQVIAGEEELFGRTCRQIYPEAREPLVLEGITLEAIPFLPHSRSSYVYRMGNCLFSGAIVHAGTLGETPTNYNEELLIATVKDQLFTLPGADSDLLLLPSVGPPSTLRAELHLSPYYREFEAAE